MKKIYIPTRSADDWRQLLAEPNKQWRSGYSAKALASCWEASNHEFPGEIKKIFNSSMFPHLQKLELLLGFPEWKVYLPPTRGHASQNDLFVLAMDSNCDLVALMVEGKVNETFDRYVAQWNKNQTPGKKVRLEFIQSKLGLDGKYLDGLRYQLLHRTVSAIMEAERFKAKSAVMLIQSFSQSNQWFEDFSAYLEIFSIVNSRPNTLYLLREYPNLTLYSGWVRGNPIFLK